MTAPTTADDAAAFLQSVGQILELKQERTVEGQAQYLQQKEALAGQLKAYFTRRLEQTGGAMTQEILQVADQLYIEGIASLLPEAIGVNKGTLNRLLARERKIECRRCHTRFPVVELRKIGGYTDKVDLCSDCLTEVKGSWSAITEHVAGEFQRAAALDQMVAETERPLALPEFTARLNQPKPVRAILGNGARSRADLLSSNSPYRRSLRWWDVSRDRTRSDRPGMHGMWHQTGPPMVDERKHDRHRSSAGELARRGQPQATRWPPFPLISSPTGPVDRAADPPGIFLGHPPFPSGPDATAPVMR